VAQAEQKLVGESFTRDDLVSARDVHLELFRESLQEESDLPDDHPVSRFRKNLGVILGLLERLRDSLKSVGRKGSFEAALVDRLLDAENHNVGQESTLFPLLERHGTYLGTVDVVQDATELRSLAGQKSLL